MNIMDRIKHYFSPPAFSDQDKTLKARSSFFLAIVGFITSTFVFTFFLIFSPENIFRLLVIGFSIPLSLLPFVFLRKGYVRATILFQASIIWVSVVATSISTGGVRSIGFIGGTIAALLVMGIALERLSTFVFITVSIFTAVTLEWGEVRGFINPSRAAENPIVSVVTYASFLFVLTGLLYVTYRNVTEALSQAHREIEERKRAEAEREELIRKLENEIKERHRLQEERELYISELNEQNAEMERLTYTVSHDLRSPLVTIKGFLGMLAKDIENNQSERVHRDFERISNATDQMQALLSDLLEFSRIGRIVNPPEEIDLVLLTREVLFALESQIRSHNIQVHIYNLPHLYADRVRMREVMQNLLENAARYMGEQQTPVIEVGMREQGDQPVIFVKDNGIGIDPKYHTRIFGLFEKLDPSIEGTGIGLAIVKRIVELHGGQIWVESEGLGKGSIFCFTIPDNRSGTSQDQDSAG
jgi:signal transduction histidine kinase